MSIDKNYKRWWIKLEYTLSDALPKTVEGEAAFAASGSNIAGVGERTWMISGGMASRVFFSPDKGSTWDVFETRLVQGQPTLCAEFHD